MAKAARCLLAPQGPCSRNEAAWETICLSYYTHWQQTAHKCFLSHFLAVYWKMIHGVSPSCGLSTTAPALAWEAPSPQRSGQAPCTLPYASSQARGQNDCFPSSSRCCREAPASWDEVAKPCASSFTKTGWSKAVLPAGCLGHRRLLLESCSPHRILAQLQPQLRAGQCFLRLSILLSIHY